jgi:hypothetical protein
MHIFPQRESELQPACQRKVVVTRVSKVLLDYGNLVGGCKDLLDVLTRLRLISDDSPEWCIEQYAQQRSRHVRQTIIEVSDISPVR